MSRTITVEVVVADENDITGHEARVIEPAAEIEMLRAELQEMTTRWQTQMVRANRLQAEVDDIRGTDP